jgi:hypothetical protein
MLLQVIQVAYKDTTTKKDSYLNRQVLLEIRVRFKTNNLYIVHFHLLWAAKVYMSIFKRSSTTCPHHPTILIPSLSAPTSPSSVSDYRRSPSTVPPTAAFDVFVQRSDAEDFVRGGAGPHGRRQRPLVPLPASSWDSSTTRKVLPPSLTHISSAWSSPQRFLL